MYTWSKLTGRVPKTFDRRMRAWRPQIEGRSTRRKLWSRAPLSGVGNTRSSFGCADGLPTG
jgi:hypothetical protein